MRFLKHGLVFFSFIQNSLLCLSLIVTAASTDAPKKSSFSWKTGMWSECKASECGSAGLQLRSVFCVHSEGWSTHQSNCQLWKRPALQRTCVNVCEWQRQLFEWQTSAWGPCSPTPPLAAEQCVTAQNGLQKRTAICVLHLNGTTVSSHMCETFSPIPELERACLLPCPLDCVVSTFSHWSPCSRTCAPALQHRTWQVLAPPLYGGSACPSLTQVRPCSQNVAQCPSDQQKHSYSLWAGPWSPCRRKGLMPSGRTTVEFSNSLSGHIVVKSSHNIKLHAGNFLFHHHHDHHRSLKAAWDIHIGYQTRQVRCMRSDGKNAMLSLCDHVGTSVNFRSCLMPRDCDVSSWSAWSLCSKTCRAIDQSAGFRSRKRSVRTVPIAGGEECPALEEVETCNTLEELLPLCPRYDWKLTNWGPCRVRPLISQHDHRHGNSSFLCGGGIQTREAYCVRIFANRTKSHMSRPVGQNFCYNPPPSMIQFCSIPCFKPCHQSDWSPWGPCIHDNSVEHPGTKGFKSRMRFIVEEPWGESESCPHVSEAMTCDHPISFQWHVISQGPCMPQNGACGHGVQEQAVECVSVTGDVVPTERCPGDPPPLQKSCEMPCPEDCVLGEWSSWSSCSHCCSTKQVQGKQTRSRGILAPSGEHGIGCLPAPVLQQWRVCGIQVFTVYYWETSPWGPCTPDSGTDKNSTEQEEVEEMGCGTGIQTRFVSCRRSDSGELEPYSCPESTRPEQKRSCILPCKLDCIVTPFSEWGSCPTSCSPMNSSIRTQSRHRIIIQRPANGGQECPATLLEERECDPQPLCPTYRWQTHHWNQCILVPDSVRQTFGSQSETCGIGLQTRSVTCVGMDDAPADMAECVQWAGAMPIAVQKCRVACKDDCIFSSWSKFSPCQSCGGSRTRTRTLLGRSKKWWRCQQERLVEREACPCSEYHTQAHGLWSPCLFPELQPPIGYSLTKRSSHLVQRITQARHVHAEGKECGQGWRYRALACLDHHERLVNPALCNSSGVEEEACAVPCPVDCRLSEWSTWSSCSAPCGGGVKVRARWLREKPFNGGRPCPKLNVKNQAQVSEVVPCYSECNHQYSWEAEPWSMCVINPPSAISITRQTQPSCGEGIQTRRIRCVRKEEDRRSSVSDSLCGQFDQPITAQACYLPCPGQCVTSEWSLWTDCPMGCNEKEFRWRSKRVLRMPGSGHTCPELNQTQSCTNTTCVSYSYAYSDWSSCRLSDNAVCGQGTKTRLLNCIDGKGKLVELSMCKEWGPSRGKLSAPCEVGCPVDCLLSDWSLWSECSHTCGAQSQMTRSRLVVHQAGDSGRPCPSQLSQTKPCPIQPCYSWMLGDWSSCNVEGAECGDGVKERNMSCVVHWGSLSGPLHPKAVQEEHCVENGLSKVMTELQQPCSIPCPGDCHLTSWSPWSVCQLLCLDGRSFEMMGHQARSRAVIVQVLENKASCPSQVYETRPCQRGNCLSYEWVTGEWKENQRAVWCQRSDGVNVTGGCFLQTKPSTVRQCTPACTKPFSFCTQSGMCGCEKGFTEVMTSSGFLDYCTKTPESDYKKANAKRSGGRLRRLHKQNESRAWTLQPLGPDGRVRLWVYGLMAGGFIMILLIITMSFLLCKNLKDDPNSSRTQRALALAYDGDTDM